MSFRPTHYPCSNEDAHEQHDHTDGPDTYMYRCPGVEAEQEATGNCFSCMAPHSKRFPCIWGV